MSESPRLPYPKLAPVGYAALAGVEHYLNSSTSLTPVLLELVRLRASQLNGCLYCLGLHAAELRKHNEPSSRIDAVAAWPASAAFTATERAALAWTEAITNIQQGHASDAAYAAVREHFNEPAVVHLTLAIASINAFNRMAIAFRPQWHEPAESATEDKTVDTTNDDGGKVTVD